MFDVELYDRRFDWLAASLLAVPLVWLFYGGDAALVSALAFALVGALKPLNRWIGRRLAAGVFAAGVVLLLSPLLRFVFYNGYCYGGTWSPAAGISHFQSPDMCGHGLFSHFDQGLWTGTLRDLAMPVAGIGLMLLARPRPTQPEPLPEELDDHPAVLIARRVAVRWGGLILALALWLGGAWYNYHAAVVALEEQHAAELAQQQAEAAAAAEALKQQMAEEAKRKAAEAAAMAAKRVDLAWLVGGWATVDGFGPNPDRSLFCATDTGYTFKKNGKYIGASHEGTFSLKDNVVTLSNRTSFEIGEPDDGEHHALPPTDLKVERNGERLMIDGSTYGRC